MDKSNSTNIPKGLRRVSVGLRFTAWSVALMGLSVFYGVGLGEVKFKEAIRIFLIFEIISVFFHYLTGQLLQLRKWAAYSWIVISFSLALFFTMGILKPLLVKDFESAILGLIFFVFPLIFFYCSFFYLINPKVRAQFK